MAHSWQNAESGKRNYAGSPLHLRNSKLIRAARIAPLRKAEIVNSKLANSERLMTAADYIDNGKSVVTQIDACREAHLLVRDPYNDGEFLPIAIYDVVTNQEKRSGLVEFDLHVGPVLVKADTLIYWK